VNVNGTSQNVTSLKIRGLELSEWIYLVRVTSIVPMLLLSFVSQLIFSLAVNIGANQCFYFEYSSLLISKYLVPILVLVLKLASKFNCKDNAEPMNSFFFVIYCILSNGTQNRVNY